MLDDAFKQLVVDELRELRADVRQVIHLNRRVDRLERIEAVRARRRRWLKVAIATVLSFLPTFLSGGTKGSK